MRSKSSLIIVIILVVAVAMVAGIAWLTRAQSVPTAAAPAGTDPPGVFADRAVTDCWAVELPPVGEEINATLDISSKKLRVSYLDPRLGEDRVVYISYEEPACQENPRLKKIIDAELHVYAQTIANTCRSMREVVRRGKPEVGPPGRPVERINLEEAKKYLERWCK